MPQQLPSTSNTFHPPITVNPMVDRYENHPAAEIHVSHDVKEKNESRQTPSGQLGYSQIHRDIFVNC